MRLDKKTLYEMIRTQMAEVEVGAADTGKEVIELESVIKKLMGAGLEAEVAEKLYDELVGQLVNVHGIDRSIIAEIALSKAAPARQGRMSTKGKVVDLSAVKIDDGDVADVKRVLDSLLRPHGLTVSFDGAPAAQPPAAAEPEKEAKVIFGINSKDNPESLLNILNRKTDLTPVQISSLLKAVIATSSEVVLENSLVGARSEMDRVITGDRTAALMKFIKDMDLDKDSLSKLMGAMNLWGRMNTVRYEKPVAAAPAAQKPATPSDKPAKKQRPGIDYDGTPVAAAGQGTPDDLTVNVPGDAPARPSKSRKKNKKAQRTGIDYDGTPAASPATPEDLTLSFPGDEPSRSEEVPQEPEPTSDKKTTPSKQGRTAEPAATPDATKLKVGPDNSVEVDGKTKFIRSSKDHEGKDVVVGEDGKAKIAGKGRALKLYNTPLRTKKPKEAPEQAPTEEPTAEKPETAEAPEAPEATEPEATESEEEEEEANGTESEAGADATNWEYTPYDQDKVSAALDKINRNKSIKDNLIDGEGSDAKNYFTNGKKGLPFNTMVKNAKKSNKRKMDIDKAKSELMDTLSGIESTRGERKRALASYARGLAAFIRQQAKDKRGIARPDGADMSQTFSESNNKDSLNESFMLRWKQLAGIL